MAGSWEHVRAELAKVEEALARLELAIPARESADVLGFGVSCRIAGMVEGVHAQLDLVKRWSYRAEMAGKEAVR